MHNEHVYLWHRYVGWLAKEQGALMACTFRWQWALEEYSAQRADLTVQRLRGKSA